MPRCGKWVALAGFAGWVLHAIAAEPIPARDFARHPEYTAVRISPGGEYLAVTVPVEDRTNLAVLRLKDLSLAGAMNFGSNEHVADFWWVGDQRLLITPSIKDGALEMPLLTGEMVAMNADGSQKAYLFGYRGGRSTFAQADTASYSWATLLDPLWDDPAHVLIESHSFGDGEDSVTLVYRLNIYTGARSVVASSPAKGHARFLADTQGRVRYAVIADIHNKLQTWYSDGSEWKRENAAALENAEIEPVLFSRDGISVYLNSRENEDRSCLVKREIGSAVRQVLACDEAVDLLGTLISADESEVVAAMFEPGIPRLVPLETHPDARMYAGLAATFQAKGEFAVPVSATRDGAQIVVLAYSDRNPGDYYLFDRKTRQARYLLSARSWIDPAEMAERRPVEYRTRDGHRIRGYLTLPPGKDARDLPLVVHPHGGPFGIRDGWRWEPDAQFLASRGYAVLQPNYRASGGYGRYHRESAKRGFGTTMMDDIADGARWAIAQKIADPSRICIYGGSFGGYAAVMGAVREPDLYRCAVGYVGVYDLNLQARKADYAGSRGGRNYTEEFVGDRGLREQHSPLSHLDRLKAPLLIVHGGLDQRVPIANAKALRKALDRRKHPYEWLVKDKEGHGFYKVENRTELYEKLAGFLDRHIGAKAPAEPVVADEPAPAIATTGNDPR